ncbi:MAG: glucose-6-phosphate isomerase [Planctomycetales bacterium]|nr:glucose-6-phosphate isomerase [Planctomycetales bacterium]NIM09179.1 glucose-6-phosphate isomerase [Planctomycetales bacterium]NIN08655.1 glucose-6-phosphate isomerase [Planctomycetales bacterium]NIN77774.1 glucose-6-phosphate isomerase [Planctomycetales bacterium]NIO34951.1 glucose-6-phosphate isomerase [Planctomycetales bacterium]
MLNFTEISYDPSRIVGRYLADAQLNNLLPPLEQARQEVMEEVALWDSGAAVPADKQPLDAGFVDLPQRILDDYRQDRQGSELGRILQTAERLRDQVDTVVVTGIGGSYMGTRALFEACCHPYHNQLSRETRDRRPRLFFAGDNVDNDALAGLLDLLNEGSWDQPADRWAMVVISKSGGTLETAVAFRLLLEALANRGGGQPAELSHLIIPVTGPAGKLFELATALDCPDRFLIPEGVGGRFSIFTPVGLLPAAILGLDVVALLEGAVAMNERFRQAKPSDNPVLQYVAVCHWMEVEQGRDVRVLSTWGKSLEAVGLWYDQLLAESLGKEGRGALPLTVVNTRDLHSRGQQHQEGPRDKLITNLIVDQVRRDHLRISRSDLNQDALNELAGKSLPDIMRAAIQGTNLAYEEDQRPTADIHLPRADEPALGQLLQMLMLATVLEGRLIGINPYGQPGVEAYKRHMNEFLRR